MVVIRAIGARRLWKAFAAARFVPLRARAELPAQVAAMFTAAVLDVAGRRGGVEAHAGRAPARVVAAAGVGVAAGVRQGALDRRPKKVGRNGGARCVQQETASEA
jgi:hypothetical protein